MFELWIPWLTLWITIFLVFFRLLACVSMNLSRSVTKTEFFNVYNSFENWNFAMNGGIRSKITISSPNWMKSLNFLNCLQTSRQFVRSMKSSCLRMMSTTSSLRTLILSWFQLLNFTNNQIKFHKLSTQSDRSSMGFLNQQSYKQTTKKSVPFREGKTLCEFIDSLEQNFINFCLKLRYIA